MQFSAKRCAYSDMPSFSSHSATCCRAALVLGERRTEPIPLHHRSRPKELLFAHQQQPSATNPALAVMRSTRRLMF